MRILLNGDSNMAGTELEDVNQSLGYQFCHMLGGEPINISFAGVGNDRIYHSTLDYIQNNESIDFILIGWSEMNRIQWFMPTDKFGDFIEVNELGVGLTVPDECQTRYQHWKKSLAHSFEFTNMMSLYWHERIYNLHLMLKHKKIPHLFFNTSDRFHIYDPRYWLDWNQRCLDPYESKQDPMTYRNWCLREGYQQITPGWYHFEPAAQQHWASVLVDHVTQNNLLEI